jgi:PAS domain S-box-containing protein
MSSHRSPEPESSERRIPNVRPALALFSLANLPIKHRLPLLIGILLVGIFVVSALASYRAVRESSLDIGRERLRNLTQQFASISQQSSLNGLNKTFVAANDPAVIAFLRSPSPATKTRAMAVLQQFSPENEPNSLQVELWDSGHSPALIIPEGSLPQPTRVEVEFEQSSREPFKAFGPLRAINDTVIAPYAAAVRDDAGIVIGHLVRWRKVGTNPAPRQLTDLLGNDAILYFGNTQGDVWTNLTEIVPRPPVSVGPNPQVAQYIRDNHSVMALGQSIRGTPWSIVIEISDQAFISHASRFLRRMTIIGIALLALGMAGAFVLSRNITRPLRALTEAASAISRGDYAHTVNIRQDDELGALASAFNSMVISTRGSQRELERKVQERTLQLEAAPWAMLMVNQEGRVTLVNTQAEKLFGYDRSELLEQPIEMLVPERYRIAHPAHRRTFSQHPTARAMGAGRDLYGLRKDGGEIPIEIGLNPITTDKGEFVLASIIDITERKLAELNLRRSQQQLAGIIGSAMDAIITIDDTERIILFNGAAEKMFLFPSEDAIGQPLDRFIPERFRLAHKGHIRNFGQTHVTRRSMGTLGALFGLRADGEEFPLEASISQVESERQKFYTVILRDITERQRSDEALKEQTRILDFAPVMIRDLKGRIIFWNSGVTKIFGWKAEEALGEISYNLLHTEFPRPLAQIKARLYADGSWEGETTHTRKDGKQIVVSSQWVLHRDQQDKPKAVLVVNNDITERKQAESEILRLNEELEQRVADRTAQLEAANKELEAFSYSVSHDLRAPLRHIDGFSQALLEDCSDKLDKEGKNYLQEVRSASQEMAHLIDDMLQLARVTRSEMRREEVDLSELATAVIAELREIDRRQGVIVNIEKGVMRQGDKRLLKIVLMNLLGNSWKFTAKRKQAEIAFGEVQKNGETYCFVRDNGAGFDMTYSNKLFGPFQRLHSTGEFEGTGIGLATVKRIINRHGGRVWAEGVVNEGAAFYFILPNFKETGTGELSLDNLKETGNGEHSDLAG